MLFRICLDVLSIDADTVQYVLKEAYDADQYCIERAMQPPLRTLKNEKELHDRAFGLAGQMLRHKDTKIYVGLTSGLFKQRCGAHVRMDYVVVLIEPEQIIGIPLNNDGPEQIRHVKCSPSMSPDSVGRFMAVMDTAVKTAF